MPVTIYWTRDTGRHDKAHFFNYYINLDEEDTYIFKANFHPEKLDKIMKARVKTPPKKVTPIQLLELCGKLPKKSRR